MWRKYLAGQLEADGRKEEVWEEYRLALKAYQEAAGRAQGDEGGGKRSRILLSMGFNEGKSSAPSHNAGAQHLIS